MSTDATPTDTGWPERCPRPPESVSKLGFKRQPMVDWLHPGQLADTGLKAVISATFGAYADKREVQAALHPIEEDGLETRSYAASSDDDGLWFDYCADLGDGFDATYGIAWLLSRPELEVEGVDRTLPRGRFVVLGGDEVYPTASSREYQDRFVGPYRAAFPWAPEEEAPELYAIPGNHDWYDGLTSFTRLLCQGRWIGAWKTRQHRSYFALELPHDWWLWGTDIQLGADIDRPQMEFFAQVAERMHQRAEGRIPRVILVTAQPSWVYCDARPAGDRGGPRKGCRLPVDPGEFESLAFFEREVIARSGVRLEVVVSGDLHHYVRYEGQGAGETTGGATSLNRRQRITCGGGGAYLYPTHHMPEELELDDSHPGPEERTVERRAHRYRCQGTFPSRQTSRDLGRWSWLPLPRRNWPFACLLAGIYLLFAWMLQSASKANNDFSAQGSSLLEGLSGLGPGEAGRAVGLFVEVLKHSPASVLATLAVLGGLWAFRRSAGPGRGLSGLAHGGAHLLLSGGLLWLLACLNVRWLGMDVDGLGHVLLFAAEMLIAGGLLGGWLFGLYLTATSQRTGTHINELFSAQSLADHKSFLRFHIDRSGKLSIYPIGVSEVPKRWRYRGGESDLGPGEAWFAPPGDRIPARLIEDEPIRTG